MAGNAGGRKGASVQDQRQRRSEDRRLGNLSTPKSVQKLQTALRSIEREEPGTASTLWYDKIYREDILAYAYVPCAAPTRGRRV